MKVKRIAHSHIAIPMINMVHFVHIQNDSMKHCNRITRFKCTPMHLLFTYFAFFIELKSWHTFHRILDKFSIIMYLLLFRFDRPNLCVFRLCACGFLSRLPLLLDELIYIIDTAGFFACLSHWRPRHNCL